MGAIQLTELSGKYGLDVRLENTDLSPDQLAIIDRVLGEMQSLRPTDFAYIEHITFLGGNERNGAYSERRTNSITVWGGFGEAVKARGSYYRPYNVDLKHVWADPSTELYLRNTLIHEMGHFGYFHSGHEYYADIDNRPRYVHETFAEDYRLFLLSGGEKVMERRGAGCRVPEYQERLQAMTDFMIGS